MNIEEKEEILGLEVDDVEIDAVTGGGSPGNGGCSANYYKEGCKATVAVGSNCWFENDYCSQLAVKYNKTKG